MFSNLWVPLNNIVLSTILSLLAVTRTTFHILKRVSGETIPVWRQSRPFSWISPILSAASLELSLREAGPHSWGGGGGGGGGELE